MKMFVVSIKPRHVTPQIVHIGFLRIDQRCLNTAFVGYVSMIDGKTFIV